MIKKIALSDRFQTAASISGEVNASHDAKVSRKTVLRSLNEIGLFVRLPAKTPLVSNKIKKLILIFAQEHALWTDDGEKYFFPMKVSSMCWDMTERNM